MRARAGLGHLISGISVAIKAGPNEGLRWSIVSAGRGCAEGTFEQAKVETIVRLIRPGERFWDIGAHKGYVSLAASRAVGPEGEVNAFEPSPENLRLLRAHLDWNSIGNVNAIPLALSDFDGECCFGGGSSLSMKLNGGDEIVRVRTVASLIEHDGMAPPTFVKIDVEGAESQVLRGAGDYLFDPERVVLVATHSKKNYEECTAILAGCGYRMVESGEMDDIRRRDWVGRGDPDILAIGPGREIPEQALEAFIRA